MRAPTPARQLDEFLDAYSPEIAALGRGVLKRMRQRLPGAVEFVYDNYNALVIGFGPDERPSNAPLSIALYPRWVNLFFLFGACLPDPGKLLKGSGSQVRSITLRRLEDFDQPGLDALMARALEATDPPFSLKGKGRLQIQAIFEKKRPRRPARDRDALA